MWGRYWWGTRQFSSPNGCFAHYVLKEQVENGFCVQLNFGPASAVNMCFHLYLREVWACLRLPLLAHITVPLIFLHLWFIPFVWHEQLCTRRVCHGWTFLGSAFHAGNSGATGKGCCRLELAHYCVCDERGCFSVNMAKLQSLAEDLHTKAIWQQRRGVCRRNQWT